MDGELFDPSEEPEEPAFDLLELPPSEPPPEEPPPSDEPFFPLDLSAESPPDPFFSEEATSLSEEAAFL